MGLTLEDIAKQAGVSRSTVSRVVNDQPNVKENVQRVQKMIQATGYHPNAAARYTRFAAFVDNWSGDPANRELFLPGPLLQLPY